MATSRLCDRWQPGQPANAGGTGLAPEELELRLYDLRRVDLRCAKCLCRVHFFVCSAERARVVLRWDEEFVSTRSARVGTRCVISGLFLEAQQVGMKIQYKVQYKRAEMGGSRLEKCPLTHMHNKP